MTRIDCGIKRKEKKLIRHLGMLTILVAAGMLAAGPAQARDLVYGTMLNPKDGALTAGMTPYFHEIQRASHGAIKWQIAPSSQLASAKGTVNALKNGLMDGAFVVTGFTPNVLPASNLIFDTLIGGGDVAATTGAGIETVLLHCPECMAEYRKVNAVPLIGYSTLPYKLMCRNVVKTVADIKGLKVRAIGPGIILMKLAGAVPVYMSPGAATTAMQRGTVDCVDGPIYWMRSFGYADVVKSVVNHDLGMTSPIGLFVINRDTWHGYSAAQRRMYIKYAPATVAAVVFRDEYAGQNQELAKARKRGELTSADKKGFDNLMARLDKVMRADNIIAARKFGVKNPTRILEAYDKALNKWQRLSKRFGNSETKFAAALQREIYSKINPDRL